MNKFKRKLYVGAKNGDIFILRTEFEYIEKSAGYCNKLTKFIGACVNCGKEYKFHSHATFFANDGIKCSCHIYEDGFTKSQRQTAKIRWIKARRGATERNLKWDLSWLEFSELVRGDCKYCGSAPTEKSLTTQKSYTDKCYNSKEEDYTVGLNGIDRVDSSLGYYKFNCVSCCKKCNYAKSDFNVEDFFSHLIKILKYNNRI